MLPCICKQHLLLFDASLTVFISSGQSLLGYEVRKKGAPHNCLDDACAAMKLVLARIENKINDAIPLTEVDVSWLL